MDKAGVRRRLLAARRALSAADRARLGRSVAANLFTLPAWKSARLIACYLSLPDEVPTQELIQRAWQDGKTVAAPVTHMRTGSLVFRRFQSPGELRQGPMGILQPRSGTVVALDEIDLLLVPGVGFDVKGYRLGYGGGFYDRVLAGYTRLSVGLAFEMQLVPELPVTPHDRPVRCVVTEQRVLMPG